MRAVVCHQGELSVEELDAPQPGKGEMVLRVRRAGICGSDLHARTHSDDTADAAAEVATPISCAPSSRWSWDTSSSARWSPTGRVPQEVGAGYRGGGAADGSR